MQRLFLSKIIICVICFCFIVNINSQAFAGRYFVRANGSNSNREVNLGYKFKFGPGQESVKQVTLIDKLKQEDTGGAGTAITLILLGGCIVAAAIIIVNKADDITDRAEDKVDEVQADVDEKYEESTQEYEETREEVEQERENYEEEESLFATGLFK